MRLLPEFGVGIGDFFGVTILDDFAVFDKDGAIAKFTNVFHGVGNEDDSLFVAFEV